MQPQEPNDDTSPNTAPTPAAAPSPQPQTPAQTPAAEPTPTPTVAPVAPTPQASNDLSRPTPTEPTEPAAPTPGKKPPVVLVASLVGAVLVIAAAIAAYFLFFSGIKLSTYDSAKYSMQYPEGYEQKTDDESVAFTEKGDKSTASVITAIYTDFPEEITQEQVDIYLTAMREQLKESGEPLEGSDVTVRNGKTEDVDFKGAKAIKVTGTGTRDGKDVGNLNAIIVLDTKKLYVVAVVADKSDPAIQSAADKILNSFTLK